MFALLQKGGIFMYCILVISIIAFALFFERVNFLYFRLKLNADLAFQKIIFLLEKMNFRGAIEECIKIETHPLGRILKAGLLRSDKKDNKEIEQAIEEKIMRESYSIRAGINYMVMFATVSALLGLLGTMIGLITTFNGLDNAGTAMRQEMITAGISKAILTTAFGLIVAIPCLIGYFILNNRGNRIIDQLREKALGLFNVLSNLKSSM